MKLLKTSDEIKESIREFLYDLERAQNDDEIYEILGNRTYMRSYRSWEKIDPQFKPGIKIEELINQWYNRVKSESANIKKSMREGTFWS